MKTTNNNTIKEQDTNKENIMPGQVVYVDHYTSQDSVRIYCMNGKSTPSKHFSVGFVFVDDHSGFMITRHQVDINATETVKNKLTFEREAQI